MWIKVQPRYEAYMLKSVRVSIKGHKRITIPVDTMIVVDPETHRAYYKAYDVQLNKVDYQIVN